ncbi:MAG: hypothetical protein AAGK14_03415 [Verrucomicrobiota bacterium]
MYLYSGSKKEFHMCKTDQPQQEDLEKDLEELRSIIAVLEQGVNTAKGGTGDDLEGTDNILAEFRGDPFADLIHGELTSYYDRLDTLLSRLKKCLEPEVLSQQSESESGPLRLVGLNCEIQSLTANLQEFFNSQINAANQPGSTSSQQARVQQARAQVTNAVANILNTWVFPAIKKIASTLWPIILNLVTPKHWKIGGEISGGIPGIGLSKASIEIQFGK